jgi:hypothetical protein
MPLSPPLVLEVGSGTKFRLLLLFNIDGPFLGLTRNLGARHPTCCFQVLTTTAIDIIGEIVLT